MKKAVLLLAGLVAFVNGLRAQDTVQFLDPPRDKYFVNDRAWAMDPTLITSTMELRHGQMAVRLISADSITIYGMAACVIDDAAQHLPNNPNYCFDTSYNEAYQFLRLYVPAGDTLRWIAQEKIHLHTTPIAYYANLDTMFPPRANRILPMYELYFDSAMTVVDTFAMGMTFLNNAGPYYAPEDTNHLHGYTYHHPGLLSGTVMFHKEVTPIDVYTCFYHENDSGSYANWNCIILGQTYFLWFPILTPEHADDTTGSGEGDDSLAVQQVQLVDRLVAVQPNPATERVMVVASCGMERLTAYDAAGKQVYRQEASGLQTTLDVSRWSAGTYILHVQTPMGTSAKRLVVTR